MNPAKDPEERKLKPRPLQPKPAADKKAAYGKQTGRAALTPAQNRRVRKTENRAKRGQR